MANGKCEQVDASTGVWDTRRKARRRPFSLRTPPRNRNELSETTVAGLLSDCWRGRPLYRAAGAPGTTSLQRVTPRNTPRVPFELR